MNLLKPRYQPKTHITTVEELGEALDRSIKAISELIATAPTMYPVLKVTGTGQSKKIYYRPLEPMKALQRQINADILSSVAFPPYVNGGIRDRNYISNCLLHTNSKMVINLDISRFFESVTEHEVYKIWQRFFLFPPDICKLLTQLTTHKGRLPRGGPTSTYLANLVFWDVEPLIESKLREKGLIYSRYIDDVCISSKRYLSDPEISDVIRQVYGMFASKKVKPNRAKEMIHYASNKGVFVHRTNVGGEQPAMRKAIRRAIRAEVHNFVKQQSAGSERSNTNVNRVMGRVEWLRQLHPERALKETQKLSAANVAAEPSTSKRVP